MVLLMSDNCHISPKHLNNDMKAEQIDYSLCCFFKVAQSCVLLSIDMLSQVNRGGKKMAVYIRAFSHILPTVKNVQELFT